MSAAQDTTSLISEYLTLGMHHSTQEGRDKLTDMLEVYRKNEATHFARLLVEARDALPAISLASARLHGVNLDLADRIEAALEPWRVAE